MTAPAQLTPNEVAALAETSRITIEKVLEQQILGPRRDTRALRQGKRRLLPLHAVAVAAVVKSLGRRLSVSDKKLVARELSRLSPAAQDGRGRGCAGLHRPGGRSGAGSRGTRRTVPVG